MISNLKESSGNSQFFLIKFVQLLSNYFYHILLLFAVGSGGTNINLIMKVLIHLYSKIHYAWLKLEALREKIFFFREKNLLRPKNWKSSRELTFANPTKSNFSQFQTFVNLPKNCKIAKTCFAKVSYFKVSLHRTPTATNAVPKQQRYRQKNQLLLLYYIST